MYKEWDGNDLSEFCERELNDTLFGKENRSRALYHV